MLGTGCAQLIGNVSHQFVVQQIGLVQRQYLRLLGKSAAIFLQLLANRFPSFYRIITGCINEVEQYLASLDMAEKAIANACSICRALDQPGNICEHEFTALVPDHAELRVDGCERISAHLSRSQTAASSPSSPGWCWRGARLVELL